MEDTDAAGAAGATATEATATEAATATAVAGERHSRPLMCWLCFHVQAPGCLFKKFKCYFSAITAELDV